MTGAGSDAAFAMFGPDHVAAIGLTLGSAVWTCRKARRDPDAPWIRGFLLGLAALQIANQTVWHAWMAFNGTWTLDESLPFHLCDAAVVVTVVALATRRPAWIETAWFWTAAGTLQGLITPDVVDAFPHYLWWQFFVTHSGLVVAGVFLVLGLGHRPQSGAVKRMMVRTNLFAVLAGLVDWATGGNYMFLREPPPTGSLLDWLGPWPWYIAAAEVVALVLFTLLDLPFRRGRRGA